MRLKDDLFALMAVPGLSGHESRVAHSIRAHLTQIGAAPQSDVLGNLWASFPGRDGPSIMIFAHMDQLGFVVRKIDADGFIRLERLGGVPERALAAQEVVITARDGSDHYGVIANKSHHATRPDEKYTVVPYADLYVDAGFDSRDAVKAAGIDIGAPVVYAPGSYMMGQNKVVGPAVDDRAGCAVLLDVARALIAMDDHPTVHLAFTVQEEFNLRGAAPLAEQLAPDIAIQLDLMLATDTPDMAERGDMRLGGGPGMSLYSFHGRGTLNGVIPHPAIVKLVEETAVAENIPLQRSAQTGVLTDLSYVQLVNGGVACVDLGFPMRYSHSAREVCDLRDLQALSQLLQAVVSRIPADLSLIRGA